MNAQIISKFFQTTAFRLLLLICLFGSADLLAQNERSLTSLPIFSRYNPELLSKKICRNNNSDEEKVRTIANWIGNHISYDTKRFVKFSYKRMDSKTILIRKKALCDEYARLFKDMCSAVEVNCLVVDGYLKGSTYESDDTLYQSDHVWNLVQVNNNWKLLDLTLYSGHMQYEFTAKEQIKYWFTHQASKSRTKFTKKIDSSWFLADPIFFIRTHLPAIDIFQLIEPKVSLIDFQNCDNKNCFNYHQISQQFEEIDSYFKSGKLDQYLFHADSCLAVNERNQFTRAIDFQLAAAQLLGQRKTNEILLTGNEDLLELKSAKKLIDTSTALIPLSRLLVQEEYAKRKYKNQTRHKLASQSIRPLVNQNKRILTFSKKLPIRDKRNIENYLKINQNLIGQKQLLLSKDLAKLNLETDSTEESYKNQFNYNNKKLSESIDSSLRIQKLISNNHRIICDSLLPLCSIKLKEIERFQTIVLELTNFSNSHRMNHMDNLDEDLADAQQFRLMYNDSIKSALWVRSQNVREVINLGLDNMDYLNLVKQIHQQTKQFADENAGLGVNSQEIYRQSLNQLAAVYDTIEHTHLNLLGYFTLEANWAPSILANSRKMDKLLQAEWMYEETRNLLKQQQIANRNLQYKALLNSMNAVNRSNSTKLKQSIKSFGKK